MFTSSALRNMDPSLEEAAEISGASAFATLFSVTFPLIMPAIVSGMLLSFVVMLGIYGIPAVLGAPTNLAVLTTYIFKLTNWSPPLYNTAAAVAIILGRPTTIWSVLRAVLRRYWALMALSLLYGLAFVAFVCPPVGIWLVTKLSLLFPALFTEEASVGTALDRTWRLTDRAFWRTFAILLLSYVLAQALQYALGALFLALAFVVPGLPIEIRIFLVVAVVTLMAQIVQPLFSIAVTLLYFDLRVRREAFDLEVMAYQLSLPEGSRS